MRFAVLWVISLFFYILKTIDPFTDGNLECINAIQFCLILLLYVRQKHQLLVSH